MWGEGVWSSLEFGSWASREPLAVCVWKLLKTLAEREVKKHVMEFQSNYLFILPQSGLAFLSSWLMYSLFLN